MFTTEQICVILSPLVVTDVPCLQFCSGVVISDQDISKVSILNVVVVQFSDIRGGRVHNQRRVNNKVG